MKQFTDVSSSSGAPMGRSDSHHGPDMGDYEGRPVRIFKVRPVDGDYDDGGAYWGFGYGVEPLWCIRTDCRGFEIFIRSISRPRAMMEAVVRFPTILWRRDPKVLEFIAMRKTGGIVTKPELIAFPINLSKRVYYRRNSDKTTPVRYVSDVIGEGKYTVVESTPPLCAATMVDESGYPYRGAPTRWLLRTADREFRVKVICYSNCASHFIMRRGESLYLHDYDFPSREKEVAHTASDVK